MLVRALLASGTSRPNQSKHTVGAHALFLLEHRSGAPCGRLWCLCSGHDARGGRRGKTGLDQVPSEVSVPLQLAAARAEGVDDERCIDGGYDEGTEIEVGPADA